MVREFLAEVNLQTGRAENRFNLLQLDQQLVFRPGEQVVSPSFSALELCFFRPVVRFLNAFVVGVLCCVMPLLVGVWDYRI